MTSENDKICNPSKTNKPKTFPTVEKTAIARIISETISLKANNDMFNRLLIIGKSRDIDLGDMLSDVLCQVSMSLGTTDGIPGKTVKAKLMHGLEKDVEPLPHVPAGSALIVEGMAFIHQIHTMPSTFGQFADRLMYMAIQCRCLMVDFVCDQYPVQSIKNCCCIPSKTYGRNGVTQISRSFHRTASSTTGGWSRWDFERERRDIDGYSGRPHHKT